MNYSETLAYLYAQLPMFHRIGAAAYKADLKNTLALCELLHHPEKKFRSVHIAGTNGKGSTSHMLAAIFQSAGFKTGLYTSPHLKDFRERIRINGIMIPEKKVIEFVDLHRDEFTKMDLSFFEWTVGLCFDYFAKEKIDLAIIETGLGGRLDSTNVISPEISVITNISKDHVNLLGDTLEKIAAEKAGIIKPGIPVVIGEEQEVIKSVFTRRAEELESELFFADHRASVHVVSRNAESIQLEVTTRSGKKFRNLETDLTGNYQEKNILIVLETIQQLQDQGWNIPEKAIYSGLKQVKGLTGLMGRWHKTGNQPLIICDVAHNEAGIREVVKQISQTPHQKLHLVLGVVNDKDVASILSLLPASAVYYFCKAGIPRALDAALLREYAMHYGLSGDVYGSVQMALQAAKREALPEDLIFIGGSTFVVAEII